MQNVSYYLPLNLFPLRLFSVFKYRVWRCFILLGPGAGRSSEMRQGPAKNRMLRAAEPLRLWYSGARC